MDDSLDLTMNTIEAVLLLEQVIYFIYVIINVFYRKKLYGIRFGITLKS